MANKLIKKVALLFPPLASLVAQRDLLLKQNEDLQVERNILREERENTRLGKYSFLEGRQAAADQFLTGEGIEVGALHNPQKVPATVKVRYVDKITVATQRAHFPELDQEDLTEVDIIDDGESLATITDDTLDFVIANHVVEHFENPIKGILNMLRVLKSGGVLFLSVPDKRFTFDKDREVTPFEHVLRDYRDGPEWSCDGHYEEWLTTMFGSLDAQQRLVKKHELKGSDNNMHYHVWARNDFFLLLDNLRREFDSGFELELLMGNGAETITVLRKQDSERP